MEFLVETFTPINLVTRSRVTSIDLLMKIPLNFHLSLSQWKRRPTSNTKSTSEKQSMKTTAEAISWESIQEEDVKCMTHSSSIPDRTTRLSKKYCSVMRLLRITGSSVFFQIKTKDLRSNLVMKWNYLQQPTSNTKSLTKTEDKDQTRISRKQLLDRFNLLPTRREKSQWASQESQTISNMLLSKRLLNK